MCATDRFWLREIGHCCLNQPRRRELRRRRRLSSFYQMRRKIPIGNSRRFHVSNYYFTGAIKFCRDAKVRKMPTEVYIQNVFELKIAMQQPKVFLQPRALLKTS